jgi:hypothetical protein
MRKRCGRRWPPMTRCCALRLRRTAVGCSSTQAFRTLVDDRTEVSVDTGLRAAEKLHTLMNSRDYTAEMAETRLWLGRIMDAVKTTVPQSMWGTILKQLGLPEERMVLDDAYFADEEPYDPTEFADEDDDL